MDMVSTAEPDPLDSLDTKVTRARASGAWWREIGHHGRRTRLLEWRRVMARRLPEILDLLQRENGKVRADAVVEMTAALTHVDWSARNARRVLSRRRVPSGPLMLNHLATVEYRPYGVIGVIGPWNYPVHTPVGSIAYALAAGNTVVFKPSEYTPAAGQWLLDTFEEAVPGRSVLQLAPGDGAVGAALCTAGVDKVAFTGSPATGARVLAACAASLTPVLLELGGKDAMVVAADADVPAAVEAALWGGCSNTGQSCAGIERVYVADPVYDRFLDLLARRAREVRSGTDFGRITMPGQLDVIRRHIEDALARGGRAVVGGPDSVRPPHVTGPVILADVPEDAAAMREETFGPVLVVNRVADAAEGVERANDSDYALGAAVFARRRAGALADGMRAGMISVNDVLSFPAVGALPFGGRGRSGFGRIHGADGLREFTVPTARTRKLFDVPLAVSTYARGGRDITRLERLVTRLYSR
ncbi:aldehyde dehydrogenase family protein [Streptomyces sp. NPDC059828]|uniref:aldehyde dehydrogenase family protein n=1 Tax=Streptomyces sp. NPDC059828 TaxID=3346965 RepID=UPI0036544C6B